MKSCYKKYLVITALIWAGCFAVFFFVHILALAPQKKSKEMLEKRWAEKKQVYDSALKAAEERTRSQLSRQVERLRNEARAFVVDFEDSANLTFDISQIAKRQNAGSFSIKGQDDRKRKDSALPDCNYIYEDDMEVSFTAGFNQFAAFLNAMERHRPVVFVDKFEISRSKKGDLTGHKVKMNLAVFVKKPQGS